MCKFSPKSSTSIATRSVVVSYGAPPILFTASCLIFFADLLHYLPVMTVEKSTRCGCYRNVVVYESTIHSRPLAETIVKAPPPPMLPAVVAPPVVTKPTMPPVTAAAAYHRQWPALPTSVPAQMVMPVTIIPVPAYSLIQHVGQVAFNPHSYLGHCHAHTGHVLPAGHFAPVPPGAGPIRYRW